MVKQSLFYLSAVASIVALVQGHGYLAIPPQRDSAWRVGFNTPATLTDNRHNCGGRDGLHTHNGGKCGVCGEEFKKMSKTLEPGPANKYALGTIVAEYEQGQMIDVTIQITAFHKGHFEFRLCENYIPQIGKDASIAVTQDCFDPNLLYSPEGETRFNATTGRSTHKVVLADDVSCSACIFQWRYITGNNWGCEDEQLREKCGIGLGIQEWFVGCADITIIPNGNLAGTNAHVTPSTGYSADDSNQPVSEVTNRPSITGVSPIKPSLEPAQNAKTTQLEIQPTIPQTYPTTLSTLRNPLNSTPAPSKTAPIPSATKPSTLNTQTTDPLTTTSMSNLKTNSPEVSRPIQITGREVKLCIGSYPYMGYRFDIWCDINCNHNPSFCPRRICVCSTSS